MQDISLKPVAPRLTIALVSATTLSYEILLTRLFSINHYHHFAYMIISLALLGYGISGTILTLFGKPLSQRFQPVFVICIAFFAGSMVLCFSAAQQIGFNAEEVLWDYHQPLKLLVVYLLLTLPFLFAAIAIGLTLMQFGSQISRLYAADLLGAGLGSVLVIVLLFMVMPASALQVLLLLGLVAMVIACWELGYWNQRLLWVVVTAVVLLFLLPANWTALNISPYKGLSQLLRVDGTRVTETRSSPLGLLQVVESSKIPLRFAPGLSLQNEVEPPPQLAVFTDADGMTAINKHVDDISKLSFLDQQTSAAVYHLGKIENVLVLGAGAGNDVLQARYSGIPEIEAVELNPQLIELLSEQLKEFSGDIYHQPGVTLHIDEARGFVSRTGNQFDVIQIALLDSHSASAAGLYSLSENYVYTREAMQEYLSRLKTDGYLSITRWIKLPPRDALKLAATVIDALHDMGVPDPGERLMLLRSWQTSTLLVKNGVISPEETERLRRFAEQRLFDVAYYPGITLDKVNRFNILRQPYYYQALQALLDDNAGQFIERYKFDINPAVDNQPYFFNFFKWSVLPEFLKLKDRGGMPLVEWGYIVLVATLLQAIVVSIILILLPLFFGRAGKVRPDKSSLYSFLYFLVIGLGFLFVEIAFMQKFVLFLHHPVYAIAVVLASFLLFAGAGSYCSNRISTDKGYTGSVKLAVTVIVFTGLAYSLVLDTIFAWLISVPIVIKGIITALLIAPLAFSMGMPFPLALSYLSKSNARLVPWVWGINGCASVISAVLAMLLAIHFGFIFVIIVAMLLYIVAALLFLRLENIGYS